MSASRQHWQELDLLRALAALIMVLSHLAAQSSLPEDQTGILRLAFIGGLAPVVFFTLTGLGFGVQSIGRKPTSWRLPLLKTGILLAADSLFWLGPGQYIGNDFLGFIGLSMLMLEGVRRLPNSGRIALALAVTAVAIRFLVGTALRSGLGLGNETSPSTTATALEFLIAARSVNGFSYHPAPWLFYPLIGYVVGRLAAIHRSTLEAHSGRVVGGLVVGGLLFGVLGAVMGMRGMAVHRFGIMSIAYFVVSLSAICTSLALALVLCRFPWVIRANQRIGFSGIRSLAFVPAHYAMIALCLALVEPPRSVPTYLAMVAFIVVAGFLITGIVPTLARGIRDERGQRAAWGIIVLLYGLTAVAQAQGMLGPRELAVAVRTAVQLLLCVLMLLTTAPKMATSPSSVAVAA